MRLLLGLLGFLLAVAYCPFIEGAATAPRWLLLAAVVPVALIWLLVIGRSIEVTIAHVAGGAFLGWAALSLAWSETPYDSVDAFWKLALLGGCFALGSLIDDLRPFLVGAALGLAISSGLLVAEVFTGWQVERLSGAQAATPYAALFGNRNYLTESCALVLVGLVAFERWRLPRIWPQAGFWTLLVPLAVAVAIPHTRGPLLAAGVAIGAIYWPARLNWARIPVLVIGVCAFSMVAYLWSPHSIHDRFNIWADVANGVTALGHGLGSMGGTLVAHFTDPMASRQVYAHNEFLQIAYELGPVGLWLAVLFVGLVLRSDRPERFVFLAFLVEACFGFPLHLPFAGAVGCVMAGCASRTLPRFGLASIVGRDFADAWRDLIDDHEG